MGVVKCGSCDVVGISILLVKLGPAMEREVGGGVKLERLGASSWMDYNTTTGPRLTAQVRQVPKWHGKLNWMEWRFLCLHSARAQQYQRISKSLVVSGVVSSAAATRLRRRVGGRGEDRKTNRGVECDSHALEI
jgi:hypothetical protein